MSEKLDELKSRLLAGDETVMDQIFREHHEKCVITLVSSYKVDRPMAEDCFMEALWLFQRQLKQGKLNSSNIGGYLYTTSKNVLLMRKRKEMTYVPLPEGREEWQLESFVHRLQEEQVNYNPLERKEEEEQSGKEQSRRHQAILLAFEDLGEKCKKLLKSYLIDGQSLKSLQVQLGYASYNVIKASKYQCKKTLVRKYGEQLSKISR